jgi:hypothetical protein
MHLYQAFWLLTAPLVGLGGFLALRPKAQEGAKGFWKAKPVTAAALVVGVVAHLLVLVSSSDFFLVPPGGHINPMGWILLMLLWAAASFTASLPLSLISLLKESHWAAGVAVLLSLTPFPFALLLVKALSAIIGFKLAD